MEDYKVRKCCYSCNNISNQTRDTFKCPVCDCDEGVALKGYNTWLQILRVDGLTVPTVADISVTEFKQVLKGAVT